MTVTPEKEPPVHVITEDGKLRICLSYVAKWIAGILATVAAAMMIGGLTFAWQANVTLGQIMEKLEAMNERLDRYYHRLERLEDKMDRKADKDDLRT